MVVCQLILADFLCKMNIMVIRKIQQEDIPQVLEVFRRVWEDTYPDLEQGISLEDVREKTSHFTSMSIAPGMFVAVIEDQIVGIAVGKKGTPNHIKSMYVTRRSIGVGSALMNALKEYFKEGAVVLTVASYNKSAIEFYRSHGFMETNNGTQSAMNSLPNGKIIPEIEMSCILESQ